MEKDNRANRYSPETRERPVPMVLDNQGNYESQSAAIKAIAPKIGCGRDTLRRWVQQEEPQTAIDGVQRPWSGRKLSVDQPGTGFCRGDEMAQPRKHARISGSFGSRSFTLINLMSSTVPSTYSQIRARTSSPEPPHQTRPKDTEIT